MYHHVLCPSILHDCRAFDETSETLHGIACYKRFYILSTAFNLPVPGSRSAATAIEKAGKGGGTSGVGFSSPDLARPPPAFLIVPTEQAILSLL